MHHFLSGWLRRRGNLRRRELPHQNGDHAGQNMARECLVCHESFASAWTGQRVCDACRSADAARATGSDR
jgi:hypothetical protein